MTMTDDHLATQQRAQTAQANAIKALRRCIEHYCDNKQPRGIREGTCLYEHGGRRCAVGLLLHNAGKMIPELASFEGNVDDVRNDLDGGDALLDSLGPFPERFLDSLQLAHDGTSDCSIGLSCETGMPDIAPDKLRERFTAVAKAFDLADLMGL